MLQAVAVGSSWQILLSQWLQPVSYWTIRELFFEVVQASTAARVQPVRESDGDPEVKRAASGVLKVSKGRQPLLAI